MLKTGEAVAIGMMAAAGIAYRIGLIKSNLVDRQKHILESFNLPTTANNLNVNALISATKSDKKSRGGSIRWVLLEGPGKATTRENIPDSVVLDSVRSVLN